LNEAAAAPRPAAPGANEFVGERRLDALLEGDSTAPQAGAPTKPTQGGPGRSAGGHDPTRRVLNEFWCDLQNLYKLLDC
jgi:hypothetical protein